MNKDLINVIEHGEKASFKGEISFQERVKSLIEGGIEHYYVDLIAFQTIYYASNGSMYTAKLPYPNPPVRGEIFSEKDVIEALRSIQRSEIIYPDFLNRIIKAGVVNYTAFLTGKQVHYVGAKGEIYIEHFPGKFQND